MLKETKETWQLNATCYLRLFGEAETKLIVNSSTLNQIVKNSDLSLKGWVISSPFHNFLSLLFDIWPSLLFDFDG